jgi:hypothetical protein
MAMNAMMHGSFSGKTMAIVSDDAASIEIWRRFYPRSIVFSKLSLQNTLKAGIHNAKPESLSSSKNDLNIESLTDFFTLALCEHILTTCRDSRFSREAQNLHPYVRTIIGNG